MQRGDRLATYQKETLPLGYCAPLQMAGRNGSTPFSPRSGHSPRFPLCSRLKRSAPSDKCTSSTTVAIIRFCPSHTVREEKIPESGLIACEQARVSEEILSKSRKACSFYQRTWTLGTVSPCPSIEQTSKIKWNRHNPCKYLTLRVNWQKASFDEQ